MILYLAIVIAIGIVLMLRKARFHYERLPKIPYTPGADVPDVTVIIPARNEEHNIERAIAGFPAEHVLVVDDRSEDRTAEIAIEMDARVLKAPPLQPGEKGKPSACMAGALAVESEWLLFIDADTHYVRVFLPSLLQYAVDEQLDMINVLLKQETVTWAEKLLLPYAYALYFTGVNSSRVNGRPPREWMANGQCLLVRRQRYLDIGGHAAVTGSFVEDIALAQRAAKQGLRSRVARAEHLGSVRMYDSFGAILRGFEKNFFRFFQANPSTGVQVFFAALLLTAWLPLLILLLLSGLYRQAAIFAVIPTLILLPWYRSPMAILAPVAIYLFHYIALSSMFKTLSGQKSD